MFCRNVLISRTDFETLISFALTLTCVCVIYQLVGSWSLLAKLHKNFWICLPSTPFPVCIKSHIFNMSSRMLAQWLAHTTWKRFGISFKLPVIPSIHEWGLKDLGLYFSPDIVYNADSSFSKPEVLKHHWKTGTTSEVCYSFKPQSWVIPYIYLVQQYLCNK